MVNFNLLTIPLHQSYYPDVLSPGVFFDACKDVQFLIEFVYMIIGPLKAGVNIFKPGYLICVQG